MTQSAPVTITERTVFWIVENVAETERATEQIEFVKTAAHLGTQISCSKINVLIYVEGRELFTNHIVLSRRV